MRDEGWLGEGSDDDWVTAGRDGRMPQDDRSDGLGSSLRDNPDFMMRGREQSRALTPATALSNSSTDGGSRSPREQRSPNENHPGLTPSRYSAEHLMSWRRQEAINSRSLSSPPNASIQQRNSFVIALAEFATFRGRSAHRASSDRGNCRNISTASLMNRIMGRSFAGRSNPNRRARPSSNITRRTSRRSHRSSMNGRGMTDPPNLATAQMTGGISHAPSRINTRIRSGSVDSPMAARGRTPIFPPIDTSRLVERIRMLPEAERSSFTARIGDLITNVRAAGPAISWGELVDRWRRVESLINQLPGA